MENEMYYLAKRISCKNFKHSLERMQDSFDERYEMMIDRLKILTIWVATDGNDITGDGSNENPYATLERALTATESTSAVSYDIRIKEGTYNIVCKDGKHNPYVYCYIHRNVAITGESSDKTILNVTARSEGSTYFLYFCKNGTVTNLTINFTPMVAGSYFVLGAAYCFVECTNVNINITSSLMQTHAFLSDRGFLILYHCLVSSTIQDATSIACFSHRGYCTVFHPKEIPIDKYGVAVGNYVRDGGHILVTGSWGSNTEIVENGGTVETY